MKWELLLLHKGPFINYVTHLGGGGGTHLCYGLLRRGGGVLAKMLHNAKMYVHLGFIFIVILS